MILTEGDIGLFLQQYFLPFCRIGGMFMAMPIIGSRLLTVKARLLLALMTSMVVVPVLPPLPAIDGMSMAIWIVIAQELVIGISVGFIFQIVFQVFVLSGQIMAMKMGLGFAAMNDPANGTQTTALPQFYLMLTTMMFLAINGHLVLISMLVNSFTTLPPGSQSVQPEMLSAVVSLGSWMFVGALTLALPVVSALLIVNIAFGVMSRAAPQLNIFAVGFPFTLICGLFIVWLGLSQYIENFHMVMDEGFIFLKNMLDPV